VGLNPGLAQFEGDDVVAEPRVEGHRTWGWETKFQLDQDGIAEAAGWLGSAHGNPKRPLLDARSTFLRLQQQAARIPPSGKACPVSTPPCVKRNSTANVVSARFAYALDWRSDGHRPRLVPSWLFTLQGNDEPIAYPA
jgi:hypothetical protein